MITKYLYSSDNDQNVKSALQFCLFMHTGCCGFSFLCYCLTPHILWMWSSRWQTTCTQGGLNMVDLHVSAGVTGGQSFDIWCAGSKYETVQKYSLFPVNSIKFNISEQLLQLFTRYNKLLCCCRGWAMRREDTRVTVTEWRVEASGSHQGQAGEGLRCHHSIHN